MRTSATSTTAPASPAGDAARNLAQIRLAAIPPAPREVPLALEAPASLPGSVLAGCAPGVPEAFVHDAPTTPVASADPAYLSMAPDPDVTVIDSIATMRARVQMTNLKPSVLPAPAHSPDTRS